MDLKAEEEPRDARLCQRARAQVAGEEAEAGHDDEDEAENQLVDREDRAAEQVLRVQRDDEEEKGGAGVVKVVVALRRLLRGLDLRRVDGGGG